MMNVILAEADPKLKYAITVLIRELPGWKVLDTASSVKDLVTLARLHQPDLVIIDMDLQGAEDSSLEQLIHPYCSRIIYLVSTPLYRTKPVYVRGDQHIWISKIESPESLVDIFNLLDLENGL
jgi:hypothetical protein